MGGNVLVRRAPKERIFGFDLIKDGDFYLPYSDVEKTLIDMVVFKQRIDSETLKKLNKQVNPKRLEEYLRRYSLRIRRQVMMYIG